MLSFSLVLVLLACILVDSDKSVGGWRAKSGRFVSKVFQAGKHGRSFIERTSREQSRPLISADSLACQDLQTNEGLRTGDRQILEGLVVPPILLLLFGASSADASYLNPQTILLRSPFFQGWLVRVTDQDQGSFIFIVGSFASKGSKKYDEHYVFCGVDLIDKEKKSKRHQYHLEHFPSPELVTIEGDRATNPGKSILVVSYVMWSGALESSDVLRHMK